MGVFDESYSSMEVAKILGVHRITVNNWIKKGALKAGATPGGRYRVTRADLRRFLSEQGMPIPPSLQLDDKKLVVAVDDDHNILKLIKSFFSKGDLPYLYNLKTFADPLEAALFIGDKKPDLVLLDLMMPDIDGFNLAKRIKAVSEATRIIVLTGYASEENISSLKKLHVDRLLSKPIDLEELKQNIEEVLSSY